MKRVTKIAIYILIFLLFLQKIYVAHTLAQANKERTIELVMKRSYNCSFVVKDLYFTVPDCRQYQEGDILEVNGRVEASFSKDSWWFDRGFFLKKRLLVSSIHKINLSDVSLEVWLKHWLLVLQLKKQQWLAEFLSSFSLDQGYLIGKIGFGSSQVGSTAVYHLFETTGTQYLLSISGFHLSLGLLFFSRVADKYLSRRWLGVVIILVALLYFLLVSSALPLVRAFLMMSLSTLAGLVLYRQSNALRVLFILVLLFIYFDTSIISTISFQLSFMASIALIWMSRLIQNEKIRQNQKNLLNNLSIYSYISIKNAYILNTLKVSFIVQLFLFPLVLHHFQEFNFFSIVTNVLVVWLFPLVILLSFVLFLSTLFGISNFLLLLFSLPLRFFAQMILTILTITSHFSLVVKASVFLWWEVAIYYLFLFSLLLAWQRSMKQQDDLSLQEYFKL